MVDPTLDPIDRAYSQAEKLLDDEAERSARRVRILAGVAEENIVRPVSRWNAARRSSFGSGWLVAAGVLMVCGFAVIKILPVEQLWNSSSTTQASAKRVQKNEMTAALSPPLATINQSQSTPSSSTPEQKQAANSTRDQKQTFGKRTGLEAPRKLPGIATPPSAVTPPVIVAEASPPAPPAPPPRAFPMAAAPLAARIAPPPPTAANVTAALPPPAARVYAMAAPPPPRAAPSAPVAAPPPPPPAAAPAPPSMADMSKPVGDSGNDARYNQLRAAASAGRADEVQELLGHQMQVDAVDADGVTALMKSVQADQPATATILIRYGANLDKKNNAGLSARDLAAQVKDPALDRALGLR